LLLGIVAGGIIAVLCVATAVHQGYTVTGDDRAAAAVHTMLVRARNSCHNYWLRLRLFCAMQ